ncbi:adenosylcobalamin-dependent ribonucleoside-diphosphate reductase [candidate division WWE3 bacterium]|uniref:Vitamin B12-dependent ribonucleotide reductase n=1 Tax=candidate division WWE3 bacterium TaxID=2053526 RepID=A0A7X9HTL8_UNCKA|nr:adenosylcobalamin-dependent ribonucleoside-diphosphate reductase [candidate division WWE3 bacterium]
MSSYLYFNDGINLEKNKSIEFAENSRKILEKRFLKRDDKGEIAETPEGMFDRLSEVIAEPDKLYRSVEFSKIEFYNLLSSRKFFPNAPTFTGAGTALGQLAACFVLPVSDDLGRYSDSIFSTLRDAALIQQSGGGNGFSFSRLRAKGTRISTSKGVSSGPIGFMKVYDAAFGEIAQGGVRRGANMGVLRVDHPDVRDFIKCKTQEGTISNFNISVAATDEFMRAVENDMTYNIVDPKTKQVVETPRAREIFDLMVEQAYKNGEPGILFIDAANRQNPVPHMYTLEATNPCGEQWLGPYESCCLGSINLALHVSKEGKVDWEELQKTTILGTRLLDNIVTANKYIPQVPQLKEAALGCRRIGLGIMGLADLMYSLGIRYGSEEAQEFSAQVMEFIKFHSMKASIELARERGPFLKIRGSIFDPENITWKVPSPLRPYSRSWNRPILHWQEIQDGIRMFGIRNAAINTIAPTGTVSLVAGVEGYGCEPVFALAYYMNVYQAAGQDKQMTLTYVSPSFQKALDSLSMDEGTKKRVIEEVLHEGSCQGIEELPEHIKNTFVVASDVTPEEHVLMQASLQAFIDNSISKTCNFPQDATREDVAKVYMMGWKLGCKGLTVYVTGSRQEVALETKSTKESKSQVSSSTQQESSMENKLAKEHESLLDSKVLDEDVNDSLLKRAYRLEGATYKVKTPQGKAFITINKTPEGKPFEVFINVGKAGTDVSALSEGLGRLVSGLLRYPDSRDDTVKEIITQLSGIGGSRSVGFGKNKVYSIPDAVAKVLAEEFGYNIPHTNGNGSASDKMSSLEEADMSKYIKESGLSSVDVCPECGNYSFVKEEGCAKCYECGYSVC